MNQQTQYATWQLCIDMQYIEQSPTKVWMPYLPRWESLPGISALTVQTLVLKRSVNQSPSAARVNRALSTRCELLECLAVRRSRRRL
jgi:hypothetical protein